METNYQKLLEDFPKTGFYAMLFAIAARDAGREEESQKYMREALRREPDNPRIRVRAKAMGISVD